MNDQSRTSAPTTCADTPSATSSQASADGPSRSDSLAGQTIATCGRVRARASLSVAPRSTGAKGSTTNDTSGRYGVISSRSDVLQSFLESSLRTRLNGSDLCAVIWKPWTTPWGAYRSKPRALAQTTPGTGSGLLPTLTSTGNLFSPSMQKWPAHRSLLPTLTAHDYRGGAKPERTERMRETSKRGTGRIDPCWALAYMGYPDEWLQSVPQATRSSRRSRRPSSKP